MESDDVKLIQWSLTVISHDKLAIELYSKNDFYLPKLISENQATMLNKNEKFENCNLFSGRIAINIVCCHKGMLILCKDVLSTFQKSGRRLELKIRTDE